ncbi:hypothetical protein P691DRAFT_810600 [Macrolepiota fuliginosa MF-IS2]|uniref:Uncharacterized protein n=1 Tax=Macrolepiota fuliginosa MF-IS2 TaxID=1400762 RepID=A0A9P6C350_9AGAR|nr:hypothetical protein P691DRAFT_810600 [Macrolepiota fuliginosa MF-IS2]
MAILGRTRTRSTGTPSPNSKAKGKAPLYSTSSSTSSTSSASTPDGGVRLSVGGIANMFIKLRHLERQSKKKQYTITCSSGAQPLTHPRTFANRKSQAKAPMLHKDTYVCAGNGGVNVVPLLRATRTALMLEASRFGANALVDESWSYVINEPKNRPRGQFKVHVQYSACATQATCCDTLQPVAMDKIRGVPGLMTVISRNGE